MKTETLIDYFRRSLSSQLFSKSDVIRRHRIKSIIYQSAPQKSRFANHAINIDPLAPITDDVIETIISYFKKINLPFTWIVNKDDDKNITNKLIQYNFKHLFVMECLYYYAISPIIYKNENIKITPVQEKDKALLKNLIIKAFEGALPDSIGLFIDEVYFNPKNKTECFFAYIKDSKFPVAYGTTYYDDNTSLAILSGAATLQEYRGQGIYHAMLLHRINSAIKKGNPLIVIEAMSKTSAPICKKFKFKKIFEQDYYSMDPAVKPQDDSLPCHPAA